MNLLSQLSPDFFEHVQDAMNERVCIALIEFRVW